MKHLSLLVAFAIAVLTASCNSTQMVPSATPYAPSQTQALTQLATPMPVSPSPTPSGTPTQLATPTLTGTVGPTGKSTTNTASAPMLAALPRLAVNVSARSSTLYNCRRQGFVPGQVLSTSYPYTQADLLLTDPSRGFYDPIWSPNGEWLAYVVSNPIKGRQTFPDGQRLVEYAESDSIWVMDADGTNKRQIGSAHQRSEYFSLHNSGESCDVVDGIFSLEGWSNDNQWLVYTYRVSSPSDAIELHFINVATGQDDIATTGVSSGSLRAQPVGDLVALLEGNPAEIGLWKFGAARPSVQSVSLPAAIAVGPIAWDSGGQGLVVAVEARNVPTGAPVTLWHLDLATGRWQQLITVGAAESVAMLSTPKASLLCQDGQLSWRDTQTWAGLYNIDPAGANCTSQQTGTDAAEQKFVGYIAGQSWRQIWGLPLDPAAHELMLVLDLNALKLPATFYALGFSWQP
jgi:hypothetical protein